MSNGNARRLASFITSLEDFVVRPRSGANYDHMGAIICDAILQAGLNYATVVAPRVQTLLRRWPTARRTSVFVSMTRRFGLNGVLSWRDPEKPRRIKHLSDFLISHSIEVESDLHNWLSIEGNSESLSVVRGIGPKTIDYIKALVGLQTIAVDRHVRSFIKWAGVPLRDYDEIRAVTCKAADLLGYEYCALDHAIWSYVSERQRSHRRLNAA